MNLDSLRKPADGLVSRWINRRVSLGVTRRLAGAAITPNQISVMTMILGVASGIAVAQGTYGMGVVGAVLLQIQSLLDGVDGELARLRSQCTRLGEWLDTVSDDLAELSFLIGLTVAVPVPWLKLLGVCGLAAYVLAKAILYYRLAIVHKSGNLQEFKWKVGAPESFASKIELLFKHDFLCLLFLVLAVVGRLDAALFLLASGAVVMFLKLLQQLFSPRRGLLRGAVTLGSLAGLFWLLSRIGWETVFLHLRRIGPWGFALLCLAGLIEAGLDARALQRATFRRVSFWSTLFLNQAGAAVNILIPGEAGEVFKASLLAKHLPVREAAASILVWNVAFRLSKSLVILSAAGLAFFLMPSDRGAALWALGLGALNLSVYFVLNAGLKRRWIGRVLTRIARSLPAIERYVAHALAAEERTADFARLHALEYVRIVSLQAGARVAGFATLWLALQLLGFGTPLPLCALIYALTELATYAVALLPTRIGTTEGSTYLIFEFLKLGGPLGAILQIVLRVKQLALASSFLILGWAVRAFSGPPLIEKVPHEA